MREFKEAKEFGFDFGEGTALEFEAGAVPDDVADFFADVDDAEVVFAADVDAEIEGRVAGDEWEERRAGLEDVWFPLTPDLSLGERENRRPIRARIGGIGIKIMIKSRNKIIEG